MKVEDYVATWAGDLSGRVMGPQQWRRALKKAAETMPELLPSLREACEDGAVIPKPWPGHPLPSGTSEVEALDDSLRRIVEWKGLDRERWIRLHGLFQVEIWRDFWHAKENLEATYNYATQRLDLILYLTVVDEVTDHDTEVSQFALRRQGYEAEIGEEMGFPVSLYDRAILSTVSLLSALGYRGRRAGEGRRPKARNCIPEGSELALQVCVWVEKSMVLRGLKVESLCPVLSPFFLWKDHFRSLKELLIRAANGLLCVSWLADEPRLLCQAGEFLFRAGRVEESIGVYLEAACLCGDKGWAVDSLRLLRIVLALVGGDPARQEMARSIEQRILFLQQDQAANDTGAGPLLGL